MCLANIGECRAAVAVVVYFHRLFPIGILPVGNLLGFKHELPVPERPSIFLAYCFTIECCCEAIKT